MRLRRYLPLLLALAPTLCWATDPLKVDILLLRLGMREEEVLQHLARQGAPVTQGPGTTDGGTALLARTRDGRLRIELSPSGETREITYFFMGHGPNEANLVRGSVLDRFGRPATEAPLTWCRAPAADGLCPPDQPRLSFRAGAGQAGVLTLTAGTAP